MLFYLGMFDLAKCATVPRAFISVNRLRRRVSDFPVNDWIMDSGSFTQVSAYGDFTMSVAEYAEYIERWKPTLAVAQDYMCEPWILEKVGRTVDDHQRMTIERYDELCDCVSYRQIMPVIQGYTPSEYVRHIEQYGTRLAHGARVGVGSVCKRNTSPSAIQEILRSVKELRPDLRLHGFGVKKTSLEWAGVRDLLFSADSMAWSYQARLSGVKSNCIAYAKRYASSIETCHVQESFL